jgi:DASS family divalent anion:Na+ symporter
MLHTSSYLKLVSLFILGLLAWNIFPCPDGLAPEGWHLLIIFTLTIIGIIFEPAPISVVTLIGALSCILTKTLTLNDVLSGFGSSIMWVVVFAFFIARGLIKTGLGKRIAYFFISKIGATTIGLSYGLIITEFLLALVIPSVSARSGGVIYPITQSIIKEYGNSNSPESVKKIGMFLTQLCFQAATISCAMFVTAMSGNPLIVSIAGEMGAMITWSNWALGAIIPGLISLALLPLLLYFICPPSIKVSKEAPDLARKALIEMGSLSKNEIIMIITFIGLIILWVFGKYFSVEATTTAMVGVVVLLLGGVLTWNDILCEKSAWDIMIWFSIIIVISGFLSKFGVMSWLGVGLEDILADVTYSKKTLLCGIIAIYFFIHYFFASITAHITVFYAIFVGLLVKLCDIEIIYAALILAYVSSLSGGLTHYGNSAAPIFFGAKYFTTIEWWRVGFIVSTLNLIIWSISGYFWWCFIGWI